jgi:uncharacterized protein DUF6984
MMERPLNENEKLVITRFAERLPHEQGNQLLADMAKATVESVTDDGSRIRFDINGYERPPYRGQHPYGVEGTAVDSDGTDLTIILYADEKDHLYELETIRWAPGKLIRPDWQTLKFH